MEDSEKVKQSVINEIEGQTIKSDAINMSSKRTLDQEQICDILCVDNIKKSDPFRGGTEFELHISSTLYFQTAKTRS
jgi:hypothetical protein